MIAALASGLLGQIEGVGSVADGVSALGSLFKPGTADASSASGAAQRPTGAGHRHGHVHAGHALSDQVQSTLLQAQSDASDGISLEPAI